jgi:ADP-heptose:LPS heptosyltransferase
VFRALQLGDMLCAVPALRALREGEPDAQITLIGLPWAREFASRFPHLIDEVLVFPGAPGFPEQPVDGAAQAAFHAAARAHRFDLAIQLHGSGTLSNDVVRQLGARAMAGFCASAADAGLAGETERLIPWPDGNEIERLLGLTRALGYPDVDTHLSFPLRPQDHAGWERLAELHGLVGGEYICVHPGARMLSRRWPVERFAEVALRLRAHWKVVVTGAPDEIMLTHRLCSLVGGDVVNLTGVTPLGELAALIAHARLLLCNDTGPSHLAAALDTPSVVVSCGGDSQRWAPLDITLHHVLASYPPCRPCGWQKCPIRHECATAITVDAVEAAALGLALQSYDHA